MLSKCQEVGGICQVVLLSRLALLHAGQVGELCQGLPADAGMRLLTMPLSVYRTHRACSMHETKANEHSVTQAARKQ